MFIGNVSKKWVFNVAMPLPPELRQSAGAVMVLTQNADELSKVVNKEGLARDGPLRCWISRTRSSVPPPPIPVNPSPLPQDMLALMTDASGTIEDVSGTSRQMYGYARLQDWSWRVVIWGPIANAQTTLISTWLYLVGGSLVLFAGSLLLAYLVARQLRIPIRQIAGMAERIGKVRSCRRSRRGFVRRTRSPSRFPMRRSIEAKRRSSSSHHARTGASHEEHHDAHSGHDAPDCAQHGVGRRVSKCGWSPLARIGQIHRTAGAGTMGGRQHVSRRGAASRYVR